MNATRTGIGENARILIQVYGDPDKGFEVDISASDGYIIGRSDSKSSYIPDIDLAVFSALEKGVSRRHAALVRYHHHVSVIDLSSVNGSFLNGERLDSEVPYLLCSGDKLRLGNLDLLITHVER